MGLIAGFACAWLDLPIELSSADHNGRRMSQWLARHAMLGLWRRWMELPAQRQLPMSLSQCLMAAVCAISAGSFAAGFGLGRGARVGLKTRHCGMESRV